jgi:hypothetical protein
MRPAGDARPKVVWQLDQRTVDPARGTDTVTQTFVPTTTCYQVGVTIASTHPSDDLYFQLGDNAADVGEAHAGEQYFFVACHLSVGVMPALRAVPDPKHNYGGRSLAYAVVVLLPFPVPQTVDGAATTATANILVLNVITAATYTVHCALDVGKMWVEAVAAGKATKPVYVNGDGGLQVNLPVGLAEIEILPEPGTGVTQHWALQLGIAPEVSGFHPADGATMRQGPGALTVRASGPGRIFLDRKPVASRYDAAAGTISYTPPQPLAAGIHIVEVAGPDGTLAPAHATIRVAPAISFQPHGTPDGTLGGQAWLRTYTPDGRYALAMPSNWQLAAQDGTVLVAEPHGAAFVQVSERMLGEAVDASQIAHTVASHWASPAHFSAIGTGVLFTTTLTSKKATKASLTFFVLPSLADHSLLLALGISTAGRPGLAAEVTKVITSFKANGDDGVTKARSWLRYENAGFNFAYPTGWLGDFTTTEMAVVAGPSDGAYLLGENVAYSGPATSTGMAAAGKQVVATITTDVHPGLRVEMSRNGRGIYRWLGTYTAPGSKTLCVEIGQAVVSGGRLQFLWGDTSAELAPSTVPALARSLDSAAESDGVTSSLRFSVAAAVSGMRTQLPATVLQGQSAGQVASSAGGGAATQDASMASFDAEMLAQQNATDMTQQSIEFSNAMNDEYGGGDNIWQPTYYDA